MTKQTKKQRYSFRKFIGDVHLWLGIASGVVLFLVCLSGTIYTFKDEIIQSLNKEVYSINLKKYTNQTLLPIDELIAKVAENTQSKVNSVSIPAEKAMAWTFSTSKESSQQKEGGRGKGRGTTYLVNPYTAAIQGTTENESSKFFMTMMQLHRWLLIEGGTGKMIVGVATLIFLVLVLSGLVLWLPAKWRKMKHWKMWKPGFTIKTSNWKRFNHDLHNVLGFYSFILLTIMALTGLCWSFEWYRDGLTNMTGAKVFGGRNEKFPGSTIPDQAINSLRAKDYIALANAQLPYEGNIRIALPADDSASAVVYKSKVGFFAAAAADKVVIDQYNGQLIKLDRFRDKPTNERIVGSIRSLHIGDVYGTFSKILYFIACLIATSLPITGTIIWINKLKKKRRKLKKPITYKKLVYADPILDVE